MYFSRHSSSVDKIWKPTWRQVALKHFLERNFILKMVRFLSKVAVLLALAISLHFLIVTTFADKGSLGEFSSLSSGRHRGFETRRQPRSYRSDKDPSKSVAAAGSSSSSSSGGTCCNSNLVAPVVAAAPRPPDKTDALFATENSTVVTAQIGSTANLPCVVKNLGNGVASWIRRHDYHLLTVGMGTYSNDDRFVVSHNRPMQNWELHVKFVKPSDEGLYECQISTHPPSSIFVKLRVVEAKAEILGEPDKHVRSGSTFELVCVLRDSTEPPVYVFWYHNDRMINYDNERGVVVSSDVEKSILTIQEAQKSDSGNYTCQPSNASPSWIVVHILNGEKPAAMQHGSRSGGGKILSTCSPSSLFFVTSLLYFLLTSWLTWVFQVSSTKIARGNCDERLSPHYYPGRRETKPLPPPPAQQAAAKKKQSSKRKKKEEEEEDSSCPPQLGKPNKRVESDFAQTGRLSSFPKSEAASSSTRSSCVCKHSSHSLGSVEVRRIFSRLQSSHLSVASDDGGPTAVSFISKTKVTSSLGCSAAPHHPHLNSTCFPPPPPPSSSPPSPSSVASLSMRGPTEESHQGYQPTTPPNTSYTSQNNNCSNLTYHKFPSVVDWADGR